MILIESFRQDNVILFPKTIEYYQSELTRLLEEERYGEAASMLRFLLQCQSDDPLYKEEWHTLLNWLTATFPELAQSGIAEYDPDSAFEADGDSEEAALLKRHVQAKAANDPAYGEKLLAMLGPQSSAEKQMTALEQLAFLDRKTIGEKLRSWVGDRGLHPLVQFKGLQVLRQIGELGTIDIHKLGQHVSVTIGQVPLRVEEYPKPIRSILDLAVKKLESEEPGLAEFAQAIWRDLVAFMYGTTIYNRLFEASEEEISLWAEALIRTIREMMSGVSDAPVPSDEGNGSDQQLAGELHKVLQLMRLFWTLSKPDEL